MYKSEIHTGMLLEVTDPEDYFIINDSHLISGRVVVFVIEKLKFKCLVEVCKLTANGRIVTTGINMNIRFRHLIKWEKTQSTQGTKWWT